MTVVRIYARDGCHLCEEAVQLVQQLDSGGVVQIDLVNIERDDELHRRYLERIPVLEVDGEQISQLVEHRSAAFSEMFVQLISS